MVKSHDKNITYDNTDPDAYKDRCIMVPGRNMRGTGSWVARNVITATKWLDLHTD
jgi:hypothetical protein